MGASRCAQLASKVLFKEGFDPSWGPLFCEGPPELPEGQPDAAATQDQEAPEAAGGPPGAPPSPHATDAVAAVGPPTLRRRRGSVSCAAGAPSCHWRQAAPVFGCGAGEAVYQVALLFRVTALEGPRGPFGESQGARGAPGSAVVVRGGTELLLQEAPARGAPPPFEVIPKPEESSEGHV